MKITIEEVLKFNPCLEAQKWAVNKYERPKELKYIIKDLEKIEHLDWANWLIARLLSKDDKVRYAIFAAEQVIEIYEKKYPDDLRPRKAIEAAKEYLKLKTKDVAYAAAYAADVAYVADAAAYAAAYAADAAAYAAADVAYVADAAAYAAAYAANAAAYAAADAAANAAANAATRKKMILKIINYGVKLLEEFHRGGK